MRDIKSINVRDSLLGEFLASILVDIEGSSSWWFSGVYGPSKTCFRDRFYDELARLPTLYGVKWCIGGDFNMMKSLQEKFNSNKTTRSMKLFDELAKEL